MLRHERYYSAPVAFEVARQSWRRKCATSRETKTRQFNLSQSLCHTPKQVHLIIRAAAECASSLLKSTTSNQEMKQVASSSEDEEGGSPPISLIENLPIIIAITAAPPIDEPPVMDGTERGVGSALQEKGGKQKVTRSCGRVRPPESICCDIDASRSRITHSGTIH